MENRWVKTIDFRNIVCVSMLVVAVMLIAGVFYYIVAISTIMPEMIYLLGCSATIFMFMILYMLRKFLRFVKSE